MKPAPPDRAGTNLLRLYLLAEANRIPVACLRLDHTDCLSIQDKAGNCYIAMDPMRLANAADETYKLAHDLGHCMTGAFYSLYSPCDVIGRSERRADVWAIKTLLPREALETAVARGYREPYQLAEHLDLPQEFVEKACAYYAAQEPPQGEIFSWD